MRWTMRDRAYVLYRQLRCEAPVEEHLANINLIEAAFRQIIADERGPEEMAICGRCGPVGLMSACKADDCQHPILAQAIDTRSAETPSARPEG